MNICSIRLPKQRCAATALALAAAAAAIAPLPAAAADPVAGPYVYAMGGRVEYDHDCWFVVACENARANTVKVGAGYRWGVFGLEASFTDFGRAKLERPGDTLRLRAAGVSAVWHLAFGSTVEGMLRAGAADVRQTRTGDTNQGSFSATFGLGLAIAVTPALAVQLGWDITGGEGRNSGSTVASAFTAGLRARF